MTNEEKIKKELSERFSFSTEQIRVARERRVFFEVPYDQFRRVFEHIVNGMEFRHLCTITGLDDGDTLAAVVPVPASEQEDGDPTEGDGPVDGGDAPLAGGGPIATGGDAPVTGGDAPAN